MMGDVSRQESAADWIPNRSGRSLRAFPVVAGGFAPEAFHRAVSQLGLADQLRRAVPGYQGRSKHSRECPRLLLEETDVLLGRLQAANELSAGPT